MPAALAQCPLRQLQDWRDNSTGCASTIPPTGLAANGVGVVERPKPTSTDRRVFRQRHRPYVTLLRIATGQT